MTSNSFHPTRAVGRARIDDATAHFDHIFVHAALALACGMALVALTVPTMRSALVGALILGAIAAFRLTRHPLRLSSISRVYIDAGKVWVAPMVGAARVVEVVALDHEEHAPWPCTLHFSDGSHTQFVARRDDGSMSFFDLELSDRARYERPRDARNTLTTVELTMRVSRPPQV
ncbi:MAG: hypothetical protein NVS3B20_06320 [Polyangiales bacterium]